jgi:hypothetical protein
MIFMDVAKSQRFKKNQKSKKSKATSTNISFSANPLIIISTKIDNSTVV